MSRKISDATKQKLRLGKGEGANYKPYITTSEFSSVGTTSVIKDWKTGRGVHCLSQGEARWYYILRWDDENLDIREQYPLDMSVMEEIAKDAGVSCPNFIMTTDFLVTKTDGTLHAYSVKPDTNLDGYTLEKLCLEKAYWIKQGAKFNILYHNDANQIQATNIRLVTEFYDPKNVFDTYSAVKHKIATKQCIIDMEHKVITTDILRGLPTDIMATSQT